MPYVVKVTRCKYPWFINVGSWIFKKFGIKLNRYIIDGVPLKPAIPIFEIECYKNDILRKIINELSKLISLATIVNFIKKCLNVKVFTYYSSIPDEIEDSLKALITGGLDGIIPDLEVNYEKLKDYGNIINICRSEVDKLCYLVTNLISLNELLAKFKQVYGVIVKSSYRLSKNILIDLKLKMYDSIGDHEFLIECCHLDITKSYIKNLQNLVNGVVISSFSNVVTLEIYESKMPNINRCINCQIDFVTHNQIKKCPYCGNKLTNLAKSGSEYKEYSPKEMKFICMEFMKEFKEDKLRIEFR